MNAITTELRLSHRFLDELPGEADVPPALLGRSRQVTEACWSPAAPTGFPQPQMVIWSSEVASELGLGADWVGSAAAASALCGNTLLPGARPYAACYGGHQFGTWAGQLGDGRAMGLGEVRGRSGRWWELQLKGAGPTAYSRRADGRAVLRSSLREFLCSEAMYHLGVPTTRALSLVTTGEPVLRDLLYDGNARYEPGAVVCRVAESFIRFGNFQLFAERDDRERLSALTRYVLRHYYPELDGPLPEVIPRLFEAVVRRTAELVAGWMRVGFVHGVLNTDNMSVLGDTLDYGPYGWVESWDLEWTPNTTDAQFRRYAFGRQPLVAHWNLARLAEAWLPLVNTIPPMQAALDSFGEHFQAADERNWAAKLGISAEELRAEPTLLPRLKEALASTEVDMTLFFRGLVDFQTGGEGELAYRSLEGALYDSSQPFMGHELLVAWLEQYAAALSRSAIEPQERRRLMLAANPRFVLRNYLAQEVIEAVEAGDSGPLWELWEVLRRPYEEQPGKERWAQKRPEWARHRPGCSMLSCSS